MSNETKERASRRWRIMALLATGVLVGTLLVSAPAQAHFLPSISHIWHHIKPKADARYLQNTKTVVVSGNVLNGNFSVLVANCPAGWQAIGGGVDPNNVFTMQVTTSNPTIGGTRTLLTPDGTHGKATGWYGGVVNNSGSTAPFKVSVICAK